MTIKKRLSTSLACLLLPVTCLLLPATCLAAYDTSVEADGSEVKDTVTGLIWRRCSEGQSWSGSTCQGTATTYTHQQALARAQTQASAAKPWRLPNVNELSSITKLGEAINPSIDTTAFPATPSSAFWSSSPYVGGPDGAWNVSFDNGVVNVNLRNGNFYVRLVR